MDRKKNLGMKMHKHPPLNALRSFECAARYGGFVQAGKELGVSSAAVSLQVKNLEAHLGKQLFLRRGNRIFLTDAGEAIYPGIASAIEQLHETTRIVQQSQNRAQVVISVLPSLSELWLLPKLARVSDQLDFSVEVRVEPDPVDFLQSGIDMRLTYSARYYHEYYQTDLYEDAAVPTCSRDFWERHGDGDESLESVPARYLICNRWGPSYASEPAWEDWFAQQGRSDMEPLSPALTFSDTSLAIAAARKGLGIALAPKRLLAGDIENGSLILPCQSEMKMQYGYVAICLHAKRKSSAIRRLLTVFGD